MIEFGIYSIKPGAVLKNKKWLRLSSSKKRYHYRSASNDDFSLPPDSIVTVLEIEEIEQIIVGTRCSFWVYHENKKFYSEVLQDEFYDFWEKLL